MGEEQTVQTEAEVAQSTRISDIYAAAKRLEGIVRKTPLIYSEFFSDISGNATYLKLENLQTTGAFKLRGAYNRISMLTEEEKARGVITASAGNHAQGVAKARCKRCDLHARDNADPQGRGDACARRNGHPPRQWI